MSKYNLNNRILLRAKPLLIAGLVSLCSLGLSGCASMFPEQDRDRAMVLDSPFGTRLVPNPLYGLTDEQIAAKDELIMTSPTKTYTINQKELP